MAKYKKEIAECKDRVLVEMDVNCNDLVLMVKALRLASYQYRLSYYDASEQMAGLAEMLMGVLDGLAEPGTPLGNLAAALREPPDDTSTTEVNEYLN